MVRMNDLAFEKLVKEHGAATFKYILSLTRQKELAEDLFQEVLLSAYLAYPSIKEQSKYKSFIEWNPLSPLIEGFRYSLFGEGMFSASMLLYSIACSIVILIAGIIFFNKVERNFMDTV